MEMLLQGAWWATLTSALGAMQRHYTDQHLGWAKRVTASAMGAYGLWPWPSSASGVTSVSARLNPPHVPPPAPEALPSPAERLTDESPALVHCRRCWADHPLSAVQTLSAHRSSEGVVTYFRCPTGHADFFTTRR